MQKHGKWIVLFGAFFNQLFSSGFANTLGLFYVEFLDAFDTSRVEVGWATSICSGLVFGAGMVAGMVVHQLGPRISGIIGGCLSFLGLFTSTFSPNISIIFITFGMIGLGSCLICVSSVVAVGQHFEKGRGGASAIALVGTGVGALIFPILIRQLTDEYGWRGALMILSGVMLHTVPISILFRPVFNKSFNPKDSSGLVEGICSPSLWKNLGFLCYLFVCPIAGIGYKYTYIVIVDMGMGLGFTKQMSTYLLIFISLANTLSTFCFGLLLRVVRNHNAFLLSCCWVTMSAVMYSFPFFKSYTAIVTGTAVYGAAMGGNIALYAVVTVDLIGLRHYSTGLGFVCTSYGIGYLLSAPMAGLINDATGSYHISFYIAGSLCLFSALTLTIVLKILKCINKTKDVQECSVIEISEKIYLPNETEA